MFCDISRKFERVRFNPSNEDVYRQQETGGQVGSAIITHVKDWLGRWESLEMVQRYTRSVTFHDSLKFYKAPLS